MSTKGRRAAAAAVAGLMAVGVVGLVVVNDDDDHEPVAANTVNPRFRPTTTSTEPSTTTTSTLELPSTTTSAPPASTTSTTLVRAVVGTEIGPSGDYDIDFVDAARGWAAGNDRVYGTTDGGATWKRLITLEEAKLTAVDFVSANVGMAAGVDRANGATAVFGSRDGGRSWYREEPVPDVGQPADLVMLDEDKALIAGGSKVIRRGAGTIWEVTSFGEGEARRFDIGHPGQVWTTLSGKGGVGASADLGGTWRTVAAPSAAVDLDFVDGTTGWFVPSSGELHKTTDGGATWAPVATGAAMAYAAVAFADGQHGWVVGAGGPNKTEPVVRLTTDGGGKWTEVKLGRVAENIVATGADHAWILAGNRVLRTTDGGRNWQ